MRETWLECEVKPGIFSDELVVEVTTADGTTKAYTVPKEEVADNKVRVKVGEKDGMKWAKLPTDHPYHAIPVRSADLSENPVPA